MTCAKTMRPISVGRSNRHSLENVLEPQVLSFTCCGTNHVVQQQQQQQQYYTGGREAWRVTSRHRSEFE
ncbi:hypothetical protein Fuma_06207 [Fuerstiella marisgermanici]|uniref:Uncharacterized protein n=1 Tax=Fuerstiella marisgermanici TaxID=1891926 RepID=A0A1P8WR92_9PLAN|nr:hypothetical protein Fuma_06207 [Fuerstiella marisgermanici]